MKLRLLFSAVFVFAAIYLSGQTAAAGDPDPLFASDDALTVRINAPFAHVMKERPTDDDPEILGTFSLIEADGGEAEFAVRILARGEYRRNPKVCPFAPLRLNFKKGDLDDTLLDKQDKLKLVTHCRNGHDRYRQSVLREYLAYRILNVMTEYSFRVRLLQITYVYNDRDDDEETTYAFLVESKSRLAKRLDMDEQDLESLTIDQLDQEYTNLVSVFQFLVGNVDFSPVRGRKGTTCCHNFSVFSADGETFRSIPYDFDLTGLVDPPHAITNSRVQQGNIRQRVYRGRCYNNAYLAATLQKFRDKRAEIDAVIAAQEELNRNHRRSVESYIASFYRRLEKGDKLIESFEDDCLS